MTKFHYVEREDLKKRFPRGFKGPANRPIATIEQVKAAGVAIHGNPDKFGISGQGRSRPCATGT